MKNTIFSLIALSVLAFGCSNKGEDKAASPAPAVPPQAAAMDYLGTGKFTVTASGSQAGIRHLFGAQSVDSEGFDPRIQEGMEVRVVEEDENPGIYKARVVKAIQVEVAQPEALVMRNTVLEVTGNASIPVGLITRKVCQFKDRRIIDSVHCKLSSNILELPPYAGTPTPLPPVSSKRFCWVTTDGQSSNALEVAPHLAGTLELPLSKKQVDSVLTRYTLNGTVFCDGHNLGLGRKVTATVQSADVPVKSSLSFSTKRDPVFLYDRSMIILANGTVVSNSLTEVLDAPVVGSK